MVFVRLQCVSRSRFLCPPRSTRSRLRAMHKSVGSKSADFSFSYIFARKNMVHIKSSGGADDKRKATAAACAGKGVS